MIIFQKGIEIDDTHANKKCKENPCTICLGLFQSDTFDAIEKAIKECSEIKRYETKKVCSAVSFPVILQLRQLIVWIALLKEFPGMFKEESPPDISIKDAFRALINTKLTDSTKELNTYIDPNGMTVMFSFTYPKEEEVLLKLPLIRPDIFKGRCPSNKPGKEFISRNAFEKYFNPSVIQITKFKEQFQVPPDIPEDIVKLDNIKVKGPTIFVAGRYTKYSRELSQSPWILKGKRIMEGSVQEYIIKHIYEYFEVPEENIVFSSSGREDVDVRCLGKGRPFLLEIPDAKKTDIPFEKAREIEIEVNKCQSIAIKDLQVVSRESTMHLKSGEEDKKKTYQALCLMNRPVTDDVIQKLNIPEGFLIQQKTPLRVLHRRPLLVRPRMIYSMTARKTDLSDKAIILVVVSQAGTYIKELVHSDFGRTNPSIKSILKEDIDISALDVLSIDLDWPREINSGIQQEEEQKESS